MSNSHLIIHAGCLLQNLLPQRGQHLCQCRLPRAWTTLHHPLLLGGLQQPRDLLQPSRCHGPTVVLVSGVPAATQVQRGDGTLAPGPVDLLQQGARQIEIGEVTGLAGLRGREGEVGVGEVGVG